MQFVRNAIHFNKFFSFNFIFLYVCFVCFYFILILSTNNKCFPWQAKWSMCDVDLSVRRHSLHIIFIKIVFGKSNIYNASKSYTIYTCIMWHARKFTLQIIGGSKNNRTNSRIEAYGLGTSNNDDGNNICLTFFTMRKKCRLFFFSLLHCFKWFVHEIRII